MKNSADIHCPYAKCPTGRHRRDSQILQEHIRLSQNSSRVSIPHDTMNAALSDFKDNIYINNYIEQDFLDECDRESEKLQDKVYFLIEERNIESKKRDNEYLKKINTINEERALVLNKKHERIRDVIEDIGCNTALSDPKFHVSVSKAIEKERNDHIFVSDPTNLPVMHALYDEVYDGIENLINFDEDSEVQYCADVNINAGNTAASLTLSMKPTQACGDKELDMISRKLNPVLQAINSGVERKEDMLPVSCDILFDEHMQTYGIYISQDGTYSVLQRGRDHTESPKPVLEHVSLKDCLKKIQPLHST